MKVAFVDTTVLTDILLKTDWQRERSVKALRSFRRTELPVYAIKEFKAGPLGHFVWLHNKLQTTKCVSATMMAVAKLMPYRRHHPATVAEALAEEFNSLGRKTPRRLAEVYGERSLDEISIEASMLSIRYRIMRAWQRRREVTTAVVLPCPCYVGTQLTLKRGLIDVRPRKCAEAGGCAIARYLRERRDELEKVFPIAKEKGGQQYQSIRSLLRTPKRTLTDGKCRALGDVVFACLCPPGAVILTTNLRDHEPLANALGKVAVSPAQGATAGAVPR
jgi:hypothetical protein